MADDLAIPCTGSFTYLRPAVAYEDAEIHLPFYAEIVNKPKD